MHAHRGLAALARVAEGDLLLARPAEDDGLRALRQGLEGRLHVETVVLREGPRAWRSRTGCAGPSRGSRLPRATGAGMRPRAFGSKYVTCPARRNGACADGVVEGKEARLELRIGEAASGQANLAEKRCPGRCPSPPRARAVGVAKGRLEGFGEPLLGVGLHFSRSTTISMCACGCARASATGRSRGPRR